MVNLINQFKLLNWKNFTLLKRNMYSVFPEIIFLVGACLFLLSMRSKYKIVDNKSKNYKAFTSYSKTTICSRETSILFAYSPTNSLLENILKNACSPSNKSSKIIIKNYKNAAQLNADIRNNKFSFVLQADDSLLEVDDIKKFPDKMDIHLRFPSENYLTNKKYEWFTDLMYSIESPRSYNHSDGGEPGYRSRSFLYFQEIITYALISNSTVKNESYPNVLIKRFPYPKWSRDNLWLQQSTESLVEVAFLVFFLPNMMNFVKDLLTEKENQVKEWMNIMGFCNWMHWLAWFIRNFIICLIAAVLFTIFLTAKIKQFPIFIYTNRSILFLFLILFGCSHTVFAFLLSTFFSEQIVSSFMVWLIYIIAWILSNIIDKLHVEAAIFLSLLVPCGIHFGAEIFCELEKNKEGAQWSNLFTPISPNNNLASLGVLFLILIFDMFLYFLIVLYIERVFPGKFGLPQPWYFPLSKNYWCGHSNFQNHLDLDQQNINKEKFENFTENFPVGIELINLSKAYGSNKAVKDLNLKMFEGHITVLLGHNGAGKTTTMSMICGMIPPTNGTVIVNGYDIRKDLQKVRESIGLCFQDDILFEDLTVWEHLYFFSKLKNLRTEETNQEINYYLEHLELKDKRNALAKTLSGGMKRKLCLGTALCGKSKIVMFDEPTTGLDPSARRAVWELLQKQKNGRTILLTTHLMDEADLLGDRIAIMSHGELQCCGSSFFLKKSYAPGYYLVLDISTKCQPKVVTDRLRGYIPNLQIHSHIGSELTYLLPEKDSRKFEIIFRDIEVNSNVLGIQTFGVSLATLEEIFLKVGVDRKSKETKLNNKESKEIKSNKIKYLEDFSLLKNQIIAMILKKTLFFLRSWSIFLVQLMFPFLLALVSKSVNVDVLFFRLKLSLDSYTEPIILLENNSSLANIYVKMLEEYQVKTVNNISSKILQLTSMSPKTVFGHYVVGASFNNTTTIAWFNGDHYHAVSLSLSLVLNAIYKEKLGIQKTITFINNPLPLSLDAEKNYLEDNDLLRFNVMLLVYGLTMTSCLYIMFYIKERVSKFKHLQIISGANGCTFWFTALFCDMILYFIIIAFLLIGLVFSKGYTPKTSIEIGFYTLTLVLYAFSALPFIYLLSYLCTSRANGFILAMYITMMIGYAVLALPLYNILSPESIATTEKVFSWSPFYMLGKGFLDITHISILRNSCLHNRPFEEQACNVSKVCCNINYFSFERPGIGLCIILLVFVLILSFVILLAKEFGIFALMFSEIPRLKLPSKQTTLESDVVEEVDKIRNTSIEVLTSNYAIVISDLTKYYCFSLAVDNLCLAVKQNECFGLLGVNGAGKTTTFKMLTGDTRISNGKVWVYGLNIQTQKQQVQKLVGYCPQSDALLDHLTVKETLLIFALIRGVPFSECIPLAESLADKYNFSEHINKNVKQLSGGNKRKLNTVLALIGDPPIIYLDEPTAGMDPATKRFFWNALAKLRDNGKCIILTSHNMEECEALCTRVGIMVNGQFQCLGSIQRLKNKFAQGYALTIKVKKVVSKQNLVSIINGINSFIQKHFPASELKERYQEQVTYHLANPNNLPLSKIFALLEEAKIRLNIEDYSLGQCSLEEVFLSFAKHQREE